MVFYTCAFHRKSEFQRRFVFTQKLEGKNDFMHLYSKVRKAWKRKRSLMWLVLVESSQRRKRKETEPKGIIGNLREAYDLRIDL